MANSVMRLPCVRKEEPRALPFEILRDLSKSARGPTTYGFKLLKKLLQNLFQKLLGLTEDTVDLSSAYWADALCHAAT